MCLVKNKGNIKSCKKALVFIGNGFDVALRYPTKYKDFYQSDEFYKLVEINNNQLCRYVHLKASHGDKWADMERCLYSYSKFITKNYGSNNVEQFRIFYQDFIQLKDAFCKYLNRVVNEQYSFNEQKKIFEQIEKMIEIWEKLDLQILNFNYTPFSAYFLQEHLKNNGKTMYRRDISPNPLLYIYQHCSLFDTSKGQNNQPTDIVLGIDRYNQSVEMQHQFLYKDNQSPYYDKTQYENLIKEKDVFIIFGCSMGMSDSSYFYSLFNMDNALTKSFIIYGYGEKEVEQLKGIVEDMGGGQIKSIYYIDDSDLSKAITKTKKIISSL